MTNTLILKATAGDLQGKQFSFSSPAYCVFGRSRSCTLRLPGDATVSRQHCLVEIDGEGIWIQDLGSLNGTFVNGQKIGARDANPKGDATMIQPPRQCLRDGDQLRICNNVFAVHVVDSEESGLTQNKGKDSHYELALCL